VTTPRSDIEPGEVDLWFEQEGESDEESPDAPKVDPGEKYAKSQLQVVRETKDYQLDYLQHALQPGREIIDISPAYQRRLRWNNKKRSLLIESFLLNIPVPPIFLFERDYNEYEVIDGRQRLDAISSFLSNGYALTGLEYWDELNRKRFRDLPVVLQKGLLRRSLSAVVLLAETAGTADNALDVRRVLFDRLNTGGISLNPQELRNSLYPGKFNALLIRLARAQTFTDVWGIPSYVPGEDKEPSQELLQNPLFATLADAELVLRFFALRDAIMHGKRGSLRDLLDRYMAEKVEVAEAEIDDMQRLFLSCLGRLYILFGDETFRLKTTKRLSRPLYDALMIALSLDEGMQIENRSDYIKTALDAAVQDRHTYDILVGRGNTIGAVYERVELATSILRAGDE
jgi:hypothetical protein